MIPPKEVEIVEFAVKNDRPEYVVVSLLAFVPQSAGRVNMGTYAVDAGQKATFKFLSNLTPFLQIRWDPIPKVKFGDEEHPLNAPAVWGYEYWSARSDDRLVEATLRVVV